MITTPKMALKVWNLLTDHFSHADLSDNWTAVDNHDHTFGSGTPIPSGGLADGAVTTNKLADGAVTSFKIGAGEITGTRIRAGAISNTLIADGAVTGAKIADGSISGADLATNSVGTSQLIDSAVTTAKLANNAVTAAKIASATITGAQIANGAVAAAEIADNTITASQIASGTITTVELHDGTILGTDIATHTIEGSNIDPTTSIQAANVSAPTIGAITGIFGSVGMQALTAGNVNYGVGTLTVSSGHGGASGAITHNCQDFNGAPVIPTAILVTPLLTTANINLGAGHSITLGIDNGNLIPTTTTFHAYVVSDADLTGMTFAFAWLALS